MPRLLIGLGVVVVILTVYTLVDCAMLDRARVRGLPRWAWVFVIVLVPVIGPVLWLIVGHGRRGSTGSRATRSFAPDDDPDFLKRLDREKTQEERIRQLERELADLDDLEPDGGTTGTGGIPDTPPRTDPGEGELPGRQGA